MIPGLHLHEEIVLALILIAVGACAGALFGALIWGITGG